MTNLPAVMKAGRFAIMRDCHEYWLGSQDRLDFTVVGPAVNEVSRIAALCRSVERDVLVSSAFFTATTEQECLVSVGRYALRGVNRPQELFTLDPSWTGNEDPEQAPVRQGKPNC